MFPKYRGKQVLMRDENGLEKCVACGLCAVACPADAIYLEAAENDGTVQAGPRYASIYQIHKTRCIFCGYCEEACPVSAIFMGKDYELAVYSNKDFIWDKEDLLVPAADAGGRRRSLRLVTGPRCRGFSKLSISACSSATARWARCSTRKGIFLNRCFDELNLTQPDLVADVHREYVRAGADVIETNTFGANRFKLANFGLADEARAHQRARARAIARHAARDAAWVAGSIGPLGVRIEPWGRTGVDEAEAAFREQAAALVEGGVDLFMLETFRDLNELLAAIRAVRSVSPLPIVAQMTTEEDGHSLDGTPPETFAPALERAGADVIGVNCSVGPGRDARDDRGDGAARRARRSPRSRTPAGRATSTAGISISARPSTWRATRAASSPPASGWSAAAAARRPSTSGRSPRAVRTDGAAAVRAGAGRAGRRAAPVVRAGRRAARSRRWRARSPSGAFVDRRRSRRRRAASISRRVVAQARRFRDLGAVAVNVPDYPKSGARASALALGVLLEQQGQVETLLHYSCRDRTSDRHAVGSGRRARDGLAQRAAHDRQPGAAGELCRCDVGVRRGRDRPHEHGVAAEPRARHRRPADRRADAVPRRRRGQSVRARSGRRVAAARCTRSRPAPSSSSRRRSSTSTRSTRCCRGCTSTGLAGPRGRRRARGPAPRGVPRERGRRRARCPTRCSTGCGAPATKRAEALAVTVEIARAAARAASRVCRSRRSTGRRRRPSGCWHGSCVRDRRAPSTPAREP